MVTWFAGLFYLPRLFVYHCEVNPDEAPHYNRFCTMERKLFWIIMTPGGILTIIFGIWLIHLLGPSYFKESIWLHIKISLVFLLLLYHVYLYTKLVQFKNRTNRKPARFFRILNEFPSLILFAVVLLAILKPSF